MTATILRADARAIPLPDASVDLIVTSPPYWSLRSYTDGGEHYDGQIGAEATPREFIAALLDCTREWMRVLKPSGSIWVNLGDKYNAYNGGRGQGTLQRNEIRQTPPRGNGLDVKGIGPKSLLMLPERYRIGCVDELGLIARAVVIWEKPNGLPESVTDRVRRNHEDWVHLTKQPRYFSAVDEIRQDYAPASLPRRNRGRDHVYDVPGQSKHNGLRDGHNNLGALPGSVWDIPVEQLRVPDHLGIDHFATFPTEWPRRIILGWSPVGGTVLDPFGGSGTTALVASVLGRHGISADMSADYCRLARWRTQDPGQRAKAARVPAPPKQFEGQGDLFEFAGAA